MANLTKAALRDRILEHLGVKAAGQSTASENAVLTEEGIDSAWARLRLRGMAPYLTSAIPDWAQAPLRDYVAAELADVFGVQGQRLQTIMGRQRKAEMEMASYVRPERPAIPTRTKFH
jgi:hypothetical protein